MAKKTQRRSGAKRAGTNRSGTKRAGAKGRRSSEKRDLVSRPQAGAYAKRTARGRFKEMDDVGRAQRADKPRKAKTKVRAGYGDQGDQRNGRSRRG